MYQKVKAYVAKHHMLAERDIVITGVSGGADSVCLLFMLLELKKEIPFEIVAVHVHHGLRGESADRDEAYVRKLCAGEGVPLEVFHEDVNEFAKTHGFTLEEGGRIVRRTVFERVRKEKNGTKIALAHHMNDNVETFLWNLCRGTGLNGLSGIAPVSGTWIRPLLCVKRKEIELYLEKRGISYCTDETNLENVYTRNKIRNEVLPYLEQHLNGQTIAHVAETVEQMRQLRAYIRAEAAEAKQSCVTVEQNKALRLSKQDYEKIAPALRPYVMHEILCEAAKKSKDIASVHIRAAEELLHRQVGKQIRLPYDVTAVRCYEGIRFQQGAQKEAIPREGKFHMRVLEREEKMQVFPENRYTKWFDYDIIKNTVKIRHRQPGDYITIDKAGNTQKLSRYFINEKIPQDQRDAIWLAADGPHIMWIVGYRQNHKYQVSESTRKILEIQLYGGEDHGRDD